MQMAVLGPLIDIEGGRCGPVHGLIRTTKISFRRTAGQLDEVGPWKPAIDKKYDVPQKFGLMIM